MGEIPLKVMQTGARGDQEMTECACINAGITGNTKKLLLFYCFHCSNGFSPSSGFISRETGIPGGSVYRTRNKLSDYGVIWTDETEGSLFVNWKRIRIYAGLEEKLVYKRTEPERYFRKAMERELKRTQTKPEPDRYDTYYRKKKIGKIKDMIIVDDDGNLQKKHDGTEYDAYEIMEQVVLGLTEEQYDALLIAFNRCGKLVDESDLGCGVDGMKKRREFLYEYKRLIV